MDVGKEHVLNTTPMSIGDSMRKELKMIKFGVAEKLCFKRALTM